MSRDKKFKGVVNPTTSQLLLMILAEHGGHAYGAVCPKNKGAINCKQALTHIKRVIKEDTGIELS